MFNSKHYVPIMKWKRAEKKALEDLKNEDRCKITPLIQLVMPSLTESEGRGKTDDEKYDSVLLKFDKTVSKIFEELKKSCKTGIVFIDTSLLFSTDLKIKSMRSILTQSMGTEIIPILVVNLGDIEEIKTEICKLSKEYVKSICLRLTCTDLDNLDNLEVSIKNLLQMADLREEDVHLIVDIKDIVALDAKYDKYVNLSQQLPNLMKWKTFTFSSGAFPVDLGKCKMQDENLLPRLDWKGWLKQYYDTKIKRVPSFSDYTIQHPIYNPASQFHPPTTSIKYTLDTSWYVMKGQKQKFSLYLANANVLVGEKDKFYGEDFSSGDKYIMNRSLHFPAYIKNPDLKGTGSTETWLYAGINHHLSLVVRQVSNLV